NTGVLLDKGTDAKPRVHKLLEAVFDLTLLDQHRANFNSPVPMGGRQAGGFEVEHHDGVGGWLWKILVHGVHHSRSREIATMGFPGPVALSTKQQICCFVRSISTKCQESNILVAFFKNEAYKFL